MEERDLWYKRAIIYALDVETFQDSNGDGIGDFQGLISRLDYLDTLGITCIWLLPFYPTPNRDNGYDVMDYYNVDKRLGDLGDFAIFMKEAKERGMKVIVDLVVNHTSNQHPWFQEARRDENSKYRNYYTWVKEKPEELIGKPAFADKQNGIWEWDEEAGMYYLHRFYAHQPDLNIASPDVRREIHHIMRFWLLMGVSGFRVDAAHILVQSDSENDKDEFYDLVEDMREFITMHSRDAILVAEASGPPHVVGSFFKAKERMHMMFNFLLNQHLFLAFARKEGAPIAKGLKMLPETVYSSQWLNFLRHHDELNIEDLEKSEQEDIFKVFAPEEDMKIFGRGIRRRLAPIFNGNRNRLELAYSLLFTLPGTPMLQYGAEIGMGDDLTLPERNSVRTAMQWEDAPNGGFSDTTEELIRPVISKGKFSYKKINVIEQQCDPGSFLNWIERLIRLRRQFLELGSGDYTILDTDNRKVFVHSSHLDYTLIALHNLSNQGCHVTLEELQQKGQFIKEVFSNKPYAAPDNGRVELDAYGYRWFRLKPKQVKKKQVVKA
ncbi:alpha-glucosidase C-terminal domain-containing protein [Pontibacter sp. KCTC 32443]|uniref:alpha-amylase family protein n=1 Tax=Pontibacter TaxID=323449 RepID=UPI00164DCEB3|nr:MULTISPECIES: alpha-amylase family protein [Pontibacter]MBC5775776.1 alpha-glucosidase C-terminal domain-containing protein [Pontibacter sp. KCTC 32443]